MQMLRAAENRALIVSFLPVMQWDYPGPPEDGMERISPPAASWLLARPLLVPRKALAVGAGRRALGAHRLS